MTLRELYETMSRDIREIKTDLKYHIKRTDLLEEKVKPVIKIYHFLQVSGALLVMLGVVAGIMRLFK